MVWAAGFVSLLSPVLIAGVADDVLDEESDANANPGVKTLSWGGLLAKDESMLSVKGIEVPAFSPEP